MIVVTVVVSGLEDEDDFLQVLRVGDYLRGWREEERLWALSSGHHTTSRPEAVRQARTHFNSLGTSAQIEYVIVEEGDRREELLDRATASGAWRTVMRDVYWEGDLPRLPDIDIWVRTGGPDGGLVIDDGPDIHGGTWNLVLENREGEAVLALWRQEDFDDDPIYVIRLRDGKILTEYMKH